MTDVRISGLHKYYGSYHALRSIDLELNSGLFAVLVGPSGCGKSTLLRSIAGLEDITEGSIRIGRREVTCMQPRDRGVAMVFQNYALYPHMNVAQNMGFALKLARKSRAEIESAVRRAAGILRIDHLLDHMPRQLSGGQRQRVAIGRAITRAPDVFLFDEPLSNLDAELRSEMRAELTRLHAELGATMIYVTHDQVEAMTMADRVVVMRDGVIEQEGRPADLYAAPSNQFVAGFLGSPRTNFIKVKVVSTDGEGFEVDLGNDLRMRFAGHHPLGANIVLGIRPEHLLPVAAPNDVGRAHIQGEITLVENLGREAVVHIRRVGKHGQAREDAIMRAIVTDATSLMRGQRISLEVDPARIMIFDQ